MNMLSRGNPVSAQKSFAASTVPRLTPTTPTPASSIFGK